MNVNKCIPKDVGKDCNENYSYVKNPFVCKTAFQVRISGDKPKNMKHETDYVFNAHNPSNGNKYLINPNNSRMSFTFGKGEEKEMTDFENMDYEVPAHVLNEKCKYKEHKEGLPLSYIQIKTEEEGIEWYKKHYPKIPDDLLPIIARYSWGDPITKKGIKNEKKKINKKLALKGFTALTIKDNNDNPFVVKFD